MQRGLRGCDFIRGRELEGAGKRGFSSSGWICVGLGSGSCTRVIEATRPWIATEGCGPRLTPRGLTVRSRWYVCLEEDIVLPVLNNTIAAQAPWTSSEDAPTRQTPLQVSQREWVDCGARGRDPRGFWSVRRTSCRLRRFQRRCPEKSGRKTVLDVGDPSYAPTGGLWLIVS